MQQQEQKQISRSGVFCAGGAGRGVSALLDWQGDVGGIHGFPDFHAFKDSDFAPAFAQALAEAEQEIAALAASEAEPDVENFLVPFELSGGRLDKFCSIFFLLSAARSDERIRGLECEFAPKLSRFYTGLLMNKALFHKIEALREKLNLPDANADAETRRAVDETYKAFIRNGAALPPEKQQRLANINERLAVLGAQFGQNVLQDTGDFVLFLEKEDLEGLPEDTVHVMRAAAAEKGRADSYALTLTRAVIVPFLTFSTRRDLREKVLKAFLARGALGGKTDNAEIMRETLALRAEKANVLGFPAYAAFKLDNSMAKSAENVMELLLPVWEKARRKAEKERDALRAFAAESGHNDALEAWDWRFYAEKLKAKLYAFDEAQLKPYLQLENILAAAFDVAQRLFGLEFTEIKNVPLWHETARLWQVRKRDEQSGASKDIGLFIGDYFARSSKQSGAWMSSLQNSHKLRGGAKPIVYNICNFAPAAPGEPCLLSLDDARTLFHEFGHALHGLLSDVRWPSISGTSVSRDFVELPSQLYEHWLTVAPIMEKFARSCKTGETMPPEFLKKIHKAKNFTSGYDTVQYVASALMDMRLHESSDIGNVAEFEKSVLADLHMPEGISMMHRPPHFKHIFDGDGYAAGYYSYMWSEVMDVDAFAAFEESGDVFNPQLAQKLYENIYSAGGSADPAALYQAFRGRLPDPQAMIKDRGLTA